MSVYKRGGVYWFDFRFKGERIQPSTDQSNRRAAADMEAAYRTALAKGDIIPERRPAPTLKDFSQRFID